MVGHKTAGVGTTNARARVHTVLVDAGQVAGTLLVAGALRLALHVGVTNVVPDALAGGRLVALRALGVDAARRGVAGLDDLNGSLRGGGGVAHREGIAHIVAVAGTQRDVVAHPAEGVHATHARTGVHAFLVLTSLVGGTVRVKLALRPAVGWGAKHARQAGAVASVSVASRRVAVASTRIRLAWILCHHRLDHLRLQPALSEGVSNVAGQTDTGGYVGPHGTLGIDATNARTGVDTFVSLARFV